MVFIGALRAVALQNVKLRVPSIKFRKGSAPTQIQPTSSTSAQPQRTSNQQPQTIVLQELPARFRRQPLSEEEIEYINRGGPA